MNYNSKKVTKRPLYDTMSGILYPAMFSPKCFKEALNYKPQHDDVFLVTYPKCGTTWMQHVLLYIFRKGEELEDWCQINTMCPFIDMNGLEGMQRMPRPGAFKTHLPCTHLPLSETAKYIFVARNPKDCVVSFYHHAQGELGFGFWDAEFDDFFELFMNGEVEYNDYFDHLLSWYPYRNNSNVFYTTYEDMKRDIRDVILRLASFLGKEFIDAIEKDNSVLPNIIKCSSFDYMRNVTQHAWNEKCSFLSAEKETEGRRHINLFMSKLEIPENFSPSSHLHLRKGIVGDWKNVLSEEQNKRLNEKFYQRLQGTDILNWFPMN